MAVLAIDTSAAISVALTTDDGTVLAERVSTERRRHAEQLTPLIGEVLEAAGQGPSNLAAVAVGTGPAPFTGLRVGLITARTLGLALDIPVWGVPIHDALAAQALALPGLTPGVELLVATDARRKEVYTTRYQITGPRPQPGRVPGWKVLAGPTVGKAADVPGGADIVVGEGAALYPESLPLTAGAPLLPTAATLAQIAIARAAAGAAQPTEPLYLRRADVHMAAPRREASPQ
ncbi:MAG: tRNA (adenosine(37)-N6)-threonylcarbamoyltransferase complex dimerization subunit type 1 TsaB [Promicromonosporaceae bacterium]|nr:tRNA (adenosine(37)-N6)-threonylcarbamoyltransferase complex dimerization subunit type 1 TsaB [Promicromonosporaceae bacterium]